MSIKGQLKKKLKTKVGGKTDEDIGDGRNGGAGGESPRREREDKNGRQIIDGGEGALGLSVRRGGKKRYINIYLQYSTKGGARRR